MRMVFLRERAGDVWLGLPVIPVFGVCSSDDGDVLRGIGGLRA